MTMFLLYDFVTALEVGANTITVTGASASAANNWDYATINYDIATGNQLNVERTNISGLGFDQPLSIAKDASNNIFITGYTENGGNKDIQTVKILPNFTVDWVANFDGVGLEDVGKSVGVDMYGNSFVTGHTYKANGSSDFITIKYDPQGNELWRQQYTSPDGWSDAQATKIFVTSTGESNIVGYITNGADKDCRLVKYDANGELLFEEAYEGIATNDIPFDVQIDPKGNIYVVGESYNAYSSSNTILKYSTYEKTDNYVLDANGNPDYIENEILVKFNPGILNNSFIDDKNLTFAPLEEVVSANVYSSLLRTLNYNPGEKQIMVLKIFNSLTSNDTISISRLGDTVKVHDFWNAVSLVFPTNINELSYAATLNNTRNLIYYAEPNFVYYPPGSSNRLYKYNMLTNELKLIFTGTTMVYRSRYGKNGWILLNLIDGNIWKIKDNGDSLTRLTNTGNCYHPHWNYDYTKIGYSTFYWGYIIDMNGNPVDTLEKYYRWAEASSWTIPNSIVTVGTLNLNIYNIETTAFESLYNFPEGENAGIGYGIAILEDKNTVIWSYKEGIFETKIDSRTTHSLYPSCNSRRFYDASHAPATDKLLWQRLDYRPVEDSSLLYIKSSIVMMNTDGTGEEKIEIPLP